MRRRRCRRRRRRRRRLRLRRRCQPNARAIHMRYRPHTRYMKNLCKKKTSTNAPRDATLMKMMSTRRTLLLHRADASTAEKEAAGGPENSTELDKRLMSLGAMKKEMQRRESQAHDTRHLEAGARARDKTLFFNHRQPLYAYTYPVAPKQQRQQQRKEYPVSVATTYVVPTHTHTHTAALLLYIYFTSAKGELARTSTFTSTNSGGGNLITQVVIMHNNTRARAKMEKRCGEAHTHTHTTHCTPLPLQGSKKSGQPSRPEGHSRPYPRSIYTTTTTTNSVAAAFRNYELFYDKANVARARSRGYLYTLLPEQFFQQKSLEQQQQQQQLAHVDIVNFRSWMNTNLAMRLSAACNRRSESVNRYNGNFQRLIIATRRARLIMNKPLLLVSLAAVLERASRAACAQSSLLVRVAAPQDFTGCSYISSAPHSRAEMPLSLDGEYYIACQSASGKSK
ncbi:unnamed protein product [Trichogramma brassicae]|uniref:Uncharacterized protein n=1 Tax=Trichogramma brassicae TaxID=86971 RepID=A0A6H5IAJ2_9HYME|nr:unnamed protein product [Trichogramma brassicae]